MAGILQIGTSPAGGAVRIMKSTAHNPSTTPRTDYDKFAFDSESGNLGYVHGITSSINSLSYYPIVSMAVRIDTSWWDFGPWLEGGFGSQVFMGARAGWTPAIATIRHPSGGNKTLRVENPPFTEFTNWAERRFLVWQLPATNTGSLFPSSTGKITGIDVAAGRIRVPRAGIGFNNGNINNFIIHENLRPAKIIAAGRVRVSSNSTRSITLPSDVPSNAFVGGQYSEPNDPVTYPYARPVGWNSISERRAQWRFSGSRTLQLRERSGRAVDVSYYVVAENNSSRTSGNGAWLERMVDSVTGRTYVQVRRPGCSNSPSFSDILLDSRWQCLPLVANGFVGKSNFSSYSGGRRAIRSIASLGYKPLVLTSWQIDQRNPGGSNFLQRIFFSGAAVYWTHADHDGYLGNTCFTEIRDGELRFYNWFERPLYYRYVANPGPGSGLIVGLNPFYPIGAGSNPRRTYWQDFVGVRYWVFAIPQG